MSATTKTTKVTGLPPRYEIRTLGREHADWAKAIVIHSNMFSSPVWPALYPENKTGRSYRGFKAADYLVDKQIDSGLSLGIFDKEYVYKRAESAATNGKLYWDLEDESVDGGTLAEQMDFPLLSVALAYDGFNALEFPRLQSLIDSLPAFADVYAGLAAGDKRDPKDWQPTGPGQVIMRNATSTKPGEEGHGFMKTMARHMMRKAADEGFRGIQIECAHDAVIHVWGNPPSPFVGHRISEINCNTYEAKAEDGTVSYPLRPSKQNLVKIYVDLKPQN
ncbi:hypothetical protein BKA67DRAFT_543499 [Truncatella angustata]|uniref:Uncharacterized protein n=1 Tax=Truncatella angustata TaxID=152316 RepID=A0A9P8UTX4_9PEZI|nr:uncharacterized protein BKA67DRAFT_543499 [Truncatella angustata]KAH6659079.1 hypothetical protein BKA67DRAFT_543499 [Truncatella angustata]KAH8201229.1 hypothetical protein TruAng_004619 [Truncatella angustata]